MSEKIHRTYEKALKRHPYGSALYIPVNAKDMYPGCIGVFNDDGHWIKASWDVTEKNHGFSPIDKDELQLTSRTFTWDVVHSEKISHMKVEVNSKVSFFTNLVPSSVEATFQIDSTSEAAAVLQCGPVTRVGIGNINLSIRDWGQENKAKVFDKAKDAKKLGGFLVVTAIYRTNWCRTRCWSSTSLKSYGKLQVAGDSDSSVLDVSFQLSTKNADKSGLSFPVGKISRGEEFVVFVEGTFFPKIGSPSRKVIYS